MYLFAASEPKQRFSIIASREWFIGGAYFADEEEEEKEEKEEEEG